MAAETNVVDVEPFGRPSVLAAIEALKRGDIIMVTDDPDRENEGDLIMAGEVSAECRQVPAREPSASVASS